MMVLDEIKETLSERTTYGIQGGLMNIRQSWEKDKPEYSMVKCTIRSLANAIPKPFNVSLSLNDVNLA